MLKKLLIFLRSDGPRATLGFIANGIQAKLGRKSVTIGLYRQAGQLPLDLPRTTTLLTVTNAEQLEALHFDRLSLTPYRHWFELGSVCHVLCRDNQPVGFGWTHFRQHHIDRFGLVDLGDNKAWLGPYFVLHNHRGHGYQRLLIAACVNNLPPHIQYALTSVNSRNTPSLRSFQRLDFTKAVTTTYQNSQTTLTHHTPQAEQIFRFSPERE